MSAHPMPAVRLILDQLTHSAAHFVLAHDPAFRLWVPLSDLPWAYRPALHPGLRCPARVERTENSLRVVEWLPLAPS